MPQKWLSEIRDCLGCQAQKQSIFERNGQEGLQMDEEGRAISDHNQTAQFDKIWPKMAKYGKTWRNMDKYVNMWQVMAILEKYRQNVAKGGQ